MATKTKKAPDPQHRPDITWRGNLSLEERETLIREAAYRRFVERGYAHGHHLQDWLAAEAEVDFGISTVESQGSADFHMQQSSVHGAAMDDELKRIVRQHPQKGIPQIESVDPKEAPSKE
jgi:Protein of unknown function (DUF2934)